MIFSTKYFFPVFFLLEVREYLMFFRSYYQPSKFTFHKRDRTATGGERFRIIFAQFFHAFCHPKATSYLPFSVQALRFRLVTSCERARLDYCIFDFPSIPEKKIKDHFVSARVDTGEAFRLTSCFSIVRLPQALEEDAATLFGCRRKV